MLKTGIDLLFKKKSNNTCINHENKTKTDIDFNSMNNLEEVTMEEKSKIAGRILCGDNNTIREDSGKSYN